MKQEIRRQTPLVLFMAAVVAATACSDLDRHDGSWLTWVVLVPSWLLACACVILLRSDWGQE